MRFFARSSFEYMHRQIEQYAGDSGAGGRLLFMMPSLPAGGCPGDRRPLDVLLCRETKPRAQPSSKLRRRWPGSGWTPMSLPPEKWRT